jgi:hypothetical protein
MAPVYRETNLPVRHWISEDARNAVGSSRAQGGIR